MISQEGDLSYLQVLAQLARFEVPHFHKTVHTPGNQKLAIRGEHGTFCIAVPPLINWHLWAGERGCVGCLPGWLFFVNLMLGPPCVSASASRTHPLARCGHAPQLDMLPPRRSSPAPSRGTSQTLSRAAVGLLWTAAGTSDVGEAGGMHCRRLTLALLPLQCLADERQQPRRGDCGDFCCQRCAQKAAV